MSVNECELYCPFILTEYVVDDSFGLYSFFVLESGLILLAWDHLLELHCC